MTKREEIARAILSVTVVKSWHDAPQSQRDLALMEADAALAAMREPTEAMVDAMEKDAGHSVYRWQAAIDAARNEQPDEEAGVERSS
jgi:hypothetical protein